MPLLRILICIIPAYATPPEALSPLHRVMRTETGQKKVAYKRIPRKTGSAAFVDDKAAFSVHQPANVDCVWDDWREWSVCQYTCGEGISVRTRSVKTSHGPGGQLCDGKLKEEKPCSGEACPVDCEWETWSSWTACSATCGKGIAKKARKAIPAKHGGRECIGSSEATEVCSLGECPVDCQWGEWSEWFACSKSCGGGKSTRYREVSVLKGAAGQDCEGSPSDSRDCSQGDCPTDCEFTEWGTWGACTVTCGAGGSMQRIRSVLTSPANGGHGCTQTSQSVPCTGLAECPVDCAWSVWDEWKACSATCGSGTRARFRFQATTASSTGHSCVGPKSEHEQCVKEACDVDCQATEWTDWSSCSVTCGSNGVSDRSRTITSHLSKGGHPCPGGSTTYDKRECVLDPCPVDCEWADWGEWRSCSKSCGNGSQLRLRMVKTQPLHDGKSCSAASSESQVCQDQECPVSCTWNTWSEWSTCPVTCGKAKITRSRTSNPASNGGAPCSGTDTAETTCHDIDCPIDCKWSDWSPWECSTSCAPGVQKRNRTILEAAQNSGAVCHGPDHETSPCTNLSTCPIDCEWANWQEWSECSATCGSGFRKRIRNKAAYASHGGHSCYGTEDDEEACAGDPCPADCVFGDWGPWSGCPVTCGNGTRTRGRGIRQQAKLGGKDCDPSTFQSNKTCVNEVCPVDCLWEDWQAWTPCTMTCGGGVRERVRKEYIHSAHGGRSCEGGLKEDQVCNEYRCPVDCHWNTWTEWGSCSKTCGTGYKTQSRTKSLAMFGGQECCGSETKEAACAETDCPVDCAWEPWTAWDNCSKSCNSGTTSRSRLKNPVESFGGAICAGMPSETKGCNTQGCPQDCLWSPWTKWTPCSKDCGGGRTKRFRDVIQTMKNHGQNCIGDDQEESDCNAQHCPIACIWAEWSVWSACDYSCNSGQRTRVRAHKQQELYGGPACVGAGTEKVACKLPQCPVDCVFSKWSDWGTCSVSCGKGSRYKTRTRLEARYGGAECSGGLVNSEECVAPENDGCPKSKTVPSADDGNLTDLLDHWLESRAASWDPEKFKGSESESNATVKPHVANESSPCTQEQVAAELAKYEESKINEKLTQVQTDMKWTRQGKAVAALVSGDLVLYASLPQALTGSGGVKFGLERTLARLAGVDSGTVTVQLRALPSTGLTAAQQKGKGNVIASFSITCYKDDKTGTAESVSKSMALHDALAVTKEIKTQLAGAESTIEAVSMSLRVTRAPN